MASEEDSVFEAPGQSGKVMDSRAPNRCKCCRVLVKEHFGPHGEGKCVFGIVVALRSRIEGLEADLQAERTEARDQEQRLKTRISALEGEVREKRHDLEQYKEKIEGMSAQLDRCDKRSCSTASLIVPGEARTTDQTRNKPKKRGKKSPVKAVTSEGQESSDARILSSSSEGEEDHKEDDKKGKKGNQQQGPENETSWSTHRPRGRTTKKPKFEPIHSDDDSWKLIVPKKPTPPKAVIYIGNLSPETTEESLERFISRRSESVGVKVPTVFNCRIYQAKTTDSERASAASGARITVPMDSADVLIDRSFWPRPAYARYWVFSQPANLDRPHTDHTSQPDKMEVEGTLK